MDQLSGTFSSSVVESGRSILDCLNAINQSPYKICIITTNQVVVGVATDGDIRRAVLSGANLADSNEVFLEKEFFKVFSDDPRADESAADLMKKHKITYCPCLDSFNHLVRIISLYDLGLRKNNGYHVIILAGGQGKRLRPLTINCPKPMIRIGDQPILEILLNKLQNLGFNSVTISVNYLKEQIIDFFGDGSDRQISIEYLIEDQFLGTAGPLSLFLPKSQSPILITNGDIITNLDYLAVVENHICHNYDVTVCVREERTKLAFGLLQTDNDLVTKIEEKPTIKHKVSAGIYVVNPVVLSSIEPSKYLDMPDLINRLISQGFRVGIYPIHDYWIDIGHPETLSTVQEEFVK